MTITLQLIEEGGSEHTAYAPLPMSIVYVRTDAAAREEHERLKAWACAVLPHPPTHGVIHLPGFSLPQIHNFIALLLKSYPHLGQIANGVAPIPTLRVQVNHGGVSFGRLHAYGMAISNLRDSTWEEINTNLARYYPRIRMHFVGNSGDYFSLRLDARPLGALTAMPISTLRPLMIRLKNMAEWAYLYTDKIKLKSNKYLKLETFEDISKFRKPALVPPSATPGSTTPRSTTSSLSEDETGVRPSDAVSSPVVPVHPRPEGLTDLLDSLTRSFTESHRRPTVPPNP